MRDHSNELVLDAFGSPSLSYIDHCHDSSNDLAIGRPHRRTISHDPSRFAATGMNAKQIIAKYLAFESAGRDGVFDGNRRAIGRFGVIGGYSLAESRAEGSLRVGENLTAGRFRLTNSPWRS